MNNAVVIIEVFSVKKVHKTASNIETIDNFKQIKGITRATWYTLWLELTAYEGNTADGSRGEPIASLMYSSYPMNAFQLVMEWGHLRCKAAEMVVPTLGSFLLTCARKTLCATDASSSRDWKYTSTVSVGSRAAFFLNFWILLTI